MQLFQLNMWFRNYATMGWMQVMFPSCCHAYSSQMVTTIHLSTLHMGPDQWKCPSMVCTGASLWEAVELWCSRDSPYLLRHIKDHLQCWNLGCHPPSPPVLREEIRQELLDKQIKERVEKYIWRIEDLEASDRIQERKFQDLQTLNATQGAIIQELQGQLEKMGQGKRTV
jgi:hypothetical protein